jgi:hypothetical protein
VLVTVCCVALLTSSDWVPNDKDASERHFEVARAYKKLQKTT